LIAKISEHIKKMPPEIRDKVVMWMSAEGSTGDPQPYKGLLDDAKYNISDNNGLILKKTCGLICISYVHQKIPAFTYW
jgi:hypothetical protein